MEYNDIGRVSTTHGVKGEVKVKTNTSFIDERFKVGETVYIKENNKYKELKIRSHRSMNGYELVAFEGINDCDMAIVLNGKLLYAIKDRSLLKDGEYFYSDYIGLNVSYFGKVDGIVKSIESFPQGDYLNISKGDKEYLVPLKKPFVEGVDLENKIVTIMDMEGLL